MSTSKVEVEKFDDKNDFNLWREKMAHLGNLGLEEALKEKFETEASKQADTLKKGKKYHHP